MYANVTKAFVGTPHMEGEPLAGRPGARMLVDLQRGQGEASLGVEGASSGGFRISPQADTLAKVGLTEREATMIASATEAGRPDF